MKRALLVILLALALVGAAFAQCELPASVFAHQDNMFSPEREMDLGDAMGQQMEKRLTPIADADLNGYLNRLGERLLRDLPDSGIHYHFLLIDEPYANAFGIAGGRIYVTRKVALITQSEDELAGLLAHEIGHIYTHQIAIDYTRRFRDMGVTSVSDRADVLKHYHQYLDTWRLRKTKWNEKKEYEGQNAADMVAIYAMSRAGYSPQTFSEFYDRLSENHGKTGSFFSDLFGTTSESSRRFKAMLNATAKLPADCVEHRNPSGEFVNWQRKLLEWRGGERVESIHNVVLKKRLEPPLQSDISRLRFSPNGAYILAQDEASINVLTHEPFAFLFRIDTPEDASGAMFTPDSNSIVVPTRSGRVETWNLIDRKRTAVHEIAQFHGCIQQAVSADGKYLACYRDDFGLDLFEVESGKKILEKQRFSPPNYIVWLSALLGNMLGEGHGDFIHMSYSPDARYFAAAGADAVYVMDLTTRSQVNISGGLSSDMKSWFAFGSQGRILTYDWGTRGGALIREFPSGKTIFKFHVGQATPTPVTKGDTVVVRPVQDYATGLVDPAADKVFLGTKSSAIDVYDKTYVLENRAGTLVLANIGEKEAINPKAVILPRAELAGLRALAVSDDLGWLAMSENSRGAVFDLRQGSREFHVRSFHGAWFDAGGTLLADFPKFEKTDRSIVSLDLKTRNFNPARKIEDKVPLMHQHGPYVVVWNKEEKHPDKVTLEVHDVRDDKLLWSRPLEGGSFFPEWMAGTGVLFWQASSSAAEKAAAADASLRQKISALSDKKQSFYLEVIELKSGKPLGSLVIDTGKASFRVRQIEATPNVVAVSDAADRLRVYSLKDGSENGVIFANRYDISNGGLLAVGAGDNRVQVFDAETLEQVDQFSFAEPIATVRFLAEGNRLLVITRDQTVFVLEPKREAGEVQAAK